MIFLAEHPKGGARTSQRRSKDRIETGGYAQARISTAIADNQRWRFEPARSNWINNYFGNSDVNAVPLAMSNFSPGHRITLSAIYSVPVGPAEASFSAYYNGQTGRPVTPIASATTSTSIKARPTTSSMSHATPAT